MKIKMDPYLGLSVLAHLGWFGCVYFARHQLDAATIIFPAVSWFFLMKTGLLNPRDRLKLVGIAMVGLAFDAAMLKFEFLNFPGRVSSILPFWMGSLWFSFVTSLPTLSRIFESRKALAALAGGVFGPLSYLAGEKFNVMIMSSEYVVLAYVGFWSIYFPATFYWLNYHEQKAEGANR